MDDRQGNGRRSTDAWVAKAGGLAVILAFVYSVAAWGVPLVGLPRRVEALEATQPDLLYMACLSFRDAHANQLPASCDRAISRGPTRQ